MQFNYSQETMIGLRAFATNLKPTPVPEYKVVHEWHAWIQVPIGYLPIRVVQFCQDQDGRAHWAIFIPTSNKRGIGNFYEVGGSFETGYYTRHIVQSRHPRWSDAERGSHLVGWVAPSYLKTFETHLDQLPNLEQGAMWDSQTFVIEALRGLDQPHMYAVQMNLRQWCCQMKILAEAWEVGDA